MLGLALLGVGVVAANRSRGGGTTDDTPAAPR
jgi:hypothetical protein